MTPQAAPSATRCCAAWPRGWPDACARKTRCAGCRATSSWWCCPT
jgi:hypothetical protein